MARRRRSIGFRVEEAGPVYEKRRPSGTSKARPQSAQPKAVVAISRARTLSVPCGRESESEIVEFRGVARAKVSGTFLRNSTSSLPRPRSARGRASSSTCTRWTRSCALGALDHCGSSLSLSSPRSSTCLCRAPLCACLSRGTRCRPLDNGSRRVIRESVQGPRKQTVGARGHRGPPGDHPWEIGATPVLPLTPTVGVQDTPRAFRGTA